VHHLTEEENQVVEQADQPVQATDQATESDESHAERQEIQKESASQRKDADYNWNELRRKVADNDRLIRDQQETINRLSASHQAKEEPSLSEDDLLTVKDLHRVNAKRDQEHQKELQKQKEEILRLKYPDIDQVLSPENIANFEQNEPELAESLMALGGDPIKMRAAAYKLIKKTQPHDTPLSIEKKKAEQNAKKPVSVQSVTKQSAIGNAHLFENGLTPELKKQLWAEIQSASKQG
jgi:hypothetical protein